MYLVERASTPGVFAVVDHLAGVSGRAHPADGSFMRVPAGTSASVAFAAASTVVVRARNAGQALTVGAITATSTSADQVLRAFGSGPATFGPGDWAQLTIVEGQYDGPLFDGDLNPDPSKWDTAWTGEPDGSASTLRQIPDDAVTPGWMPGRGVPQVVVDDPAETLQLVTDHEILADYTVTIREVG